MALVYRRFSPYSPLAAYPAAAARLRAVAAKAARRHLARLFIALLDGVRDGEDRPSRSEESRHLPCSVFDARYKGLTAQATFIDAAICRQARMR
jgi:hypothetical protein